MADGLFISYRRADSAGYAGRIADYFASEHPATTVFMDVNAIRPGSDFAETIERGLAESSVVLALIGGGWLNASTAAGRRRLEDPNDFVRLELTVAMTRQRHLVPVLLDDTPMPKVHELPAPLQPLTRYCAFRLRHEAFRRDIAALADELQPHWRGGRGDPFPEADAHVPDDVFMALVKGFADYNAMNDPEVFMIVENGVEQFVQFIGNVDGEVLMDLPSHGLSPEQIAAAQRFLQQSYTIETQELEDGALAFQTVVPAEARHLALLTLSIFENVYGETPAKPLNISFGR